MTLPPSQHSFFCHDFGRWSQVKWRQAGCTVKLSGATMISLLSLQLSVLLFAAAAPLPPERSRPKEETAVLFFNVNVRGEIEAIGEDEPLVGKEAIKKYLKRVADGYKDDGINVANVGVVIRADRNLKWGELNDIVKLCRDACFEKIQLRAIQKAAD
jgi:biopolymer transport protein ExbD